MRWIVCKLIDHDWQIEQVQLGHGKFISLGLCQRCKHQFWMKGEVGKLKGVRFVTSGEEEGVA